MQVVVPGDFIASCRGRNGEEQVNMALVGPQPTGTWVLSFLGSAREILTEENARNINKALDAIEEIMTGTENIDVDQYFPDLVSAREPNA